jgi:F-type H+-transporting ATPase subunit gamma
MEMVATSKLRRATEARTASEPYALRIAEALRDGLAAPEAHPLTQVRPVQRITLFVVASDRGLAGAFTTHLIRAALSFIATAKEAHQDVQCITMGKKCEQALRRAGVPIAESYQHSPTHPTSVDILPLTRSLLTHYQNRETDQVVVLSTRFLSVFRHSPELTTLLPIAAAELAATTASDSPYEVAEHRSELLHEHLFIYESGPVAMLDAIIPRYLESRLYQLVQESLASEHASRRAAMHSATDNAGSILDDLQLTYNSVRQGSITQELAELTSGSLAQEA